MPCRKEWPYLHLTDYGSPPVIMEIICSKPVQAAPAMKETIIVSGPFSVSPHSLCKCFSVSVPNGWLNHIILNQHGAVHDCAFQIIVKHQITIHLSVLYFLGNIYLIAFAIASVTI